MVSKLTGILVAAVCLCTSAQAEVVIPTVTVGNLGNAGEWSGESYSGHGPDRFCGTVDNEYNIGKYEIANSQYVGFLNAVAVTDTYDVFHTSMTGACGIQQNGEQGSYSYSLADGWDGDRPVNWVSWGDAARFANWMHNGQLGGSQSFSTTEDGSYYLNGATTATELMAVIREPDATWVIPSEDEWYKAAYHKNNGVTSNYWDYPTSSDTISTSMANYGNSVRHTTNSGSYPYPSPYGTFDQGGNVNEWTEEAWETLSYRTTRGGTYDDDPINLHAAHRWGDGPAGANQFIGFRLAQVPEPATLSLLTLSGLLAIKRRR